jgi:hypothetical protein
VGTQANAASRFLSPEALPSFELALIMMDLQLIRNIRW